MTVIFLKTLWWHYHFLYWVGDNPRCWAYFTTDLFKNRQYLSLNLSVQPPSEYQLPLNVPSSNTGYWPSTGAPRLLAYWTTPNSTFLSLSDPTDLLFNLRISNASALSAGILVCIVSTIAIKSFFSSFPKFSSVSDDII